jgi:hypothetical protein
MLKMGFVFESIWFWDDELFQAAGAFQERFGVHPNIMSAGLRVYGAIDEKVRNDRENVVDERGRHPGPGEEIELSGFSARDFEILFTLNEMTPYPGFLLIYDEDPCFDGEEEPVGSGHIVVRSYRAA